MVLDQQRNPRAEAVPVPTVWRVVEVALVEICAQSGIRRISTWSWTMTVSWPGHPSSGFPSARTSDRRRSRPRAVLRDPRPWPGCLAVLAPDRRAGRNYNDPRTLWRRRPGFSLDQLLGDIEQFLVGFSSSIPANIGSASRISSAYRRVSSNSSSPQGRIARYSLPRMASCPSRSSFRIAGHRARRYASSASSSLG